MQFVKKLFLGCSVVLISVAMKAQNTVASSSSAVVPRLVNFSGKATNDQGKTVTGIVGITFSIYSAQQGGAPLWMETQSVTADAKGNYTVRLGTTTSQGLPLDLFTSGEARWLGVRVNGSEEQPRVLLLSVPYALKAADAQTLGGLPASAFALAAPSGSVTPTPTEPASTPSGSSSANIGGSGTQDYIPLWTDNNGDLGNSILYQLGTGSTAKIGINEKSPLFTLDVNGQELVRGLFEMATTNYASKTKGYNSQPLNFESSAFNSTAGTYTLNHFQWQAEPVGNNTATPGATLNLLYGTDPNQPAETGLNIANSGQITFATGQAFPGTIAGVTTATGSGLSGGGTSGNLNLTLATNCGASQVLQWNGSAWACSSAGTGTITGVTAGTLLLGGGSGGNVTLNVDTSQVPQLAGNNVFTQNNTFQPFSTDAIDAYADWPGKTAVVGIQNAKSGGSYGVWARTSDPTGAAVAGIDGSGTGTGVVGTSSSGNAMVANGNVSQSRTGGGWVKAMAYIDYQVYPGSSSVLRCFNSTLQGAAATTPPCNIALTVAPGQGGPFVDFGFQVDDRFIMAQPTQLFASVLTCVDTDPACSAFGKGPTSTQVLAYVHNTDGSVGNQFYIFVY